MPADTPADQPEQRRRTDSDWEPLATAAPVAITIVVMGLYAASVIGRHADAYRHGGVAPAEASSGAVSGQIIIAVATLVAVFLYRRVWIFAQWSTRRRTLVAAGVAGGLALFFAVLPTIVGGWSVLAVFLSLVTTLLFNAVFAGVALFAVWAWPRMNW